MAEDSQVVDAGKADLARRDQAREKQLPKLGPGARLTTTHTGWKKPLCLDCHAASHPGYGFRIPDCAECHGFNGAIDPGHVSMTQACGCHPSGNHDGKLKAPDDCVSCHYHPGNPSGT